MELTNGIAFALAARRGWFTSRICEPGNQSLALAKEMSETGKDALHTGSAAHLNTEAGKP